MKATNLSLLCFLLMAAPAAVQAQSGSGCGYHYSINASNVDTITITNYTGPGGAVTIPTNINGLTVTGIGSNAFAFSPGDNILVSSVMIPNSVTSIGDYAFHGCRFLNGVVIGNSVTSIGEDAFENCHFLNSIYFEGNAPTADSTAFSGVSARTAYYIPETTGWSSTLAGIQTAPSPFGFTAQNGAITITNYTGPGGDVTIPYTVGGFPVTSIGADAFFWLPLTSITIPDSVTNIGDYAFWNCDFISSFTIPNGVLNLGTGVFENCFTATNISLPASLTNIGPRSFYACMSLTTLTLDPQNAFYSSLDGMLFDKSQSTLLLCPAGKAGPYTIPGSVTNIEDNAFFYCGGLTSVIIPDSVTSIGDAAFAGCAYLTNVMIGNSITSIGNGVFESCGLTNVNIPSNVTSIGGGAFEACPLISVTIPNSVTNLGGSAFDDCGSLTNITIGNGITSIGGAAFWSCFGLTGVTIPKSVASVGDYAFGDCFSLSNLYFQGNAPTAGSSVFLNHNNVTIYYLTGIAGWSSTFAGFPTVLWNPLIQTNDGSFGVSNNHFGFNIAGTANIPIVVQACANLANPAWATLTNVLLTNGLYYFSEPIQTNGGGRYYRITSP